MDGRPRSLSSARGQLRARPEDVALGARHLQRRQRDRRRDVGKMCQSLWKVAEHLLASGVVLLREQPQVVAGGGRAIEAVSRVVELALPSKAFGEPERARQEAALSAAHAVVRVL